MSRFFNPKSTVTPVILAEPHEGFSHGFVHLFPLQPGDRRRKRIENTVTEVATHSTFAIKRRFRRH